MQQQDLWLPGFEFGTDLFGATLDGTQHTAPQLAVTQAPAEADVPLESADSAEAENYPAACASNEPSVLVVRQAGSQDLIRDVAPWPTLTPLVHADLAGVRTKYAANVLALETLKALEASACAPDAEQRTVLNRYTGWGGIKGPFDPYPHPEWQKEAQQLKSMLSGSEFESAKESTLNAHYTPLGIVQAIWTALANAGFTGGRILDPASGPGYFIGAMPEEIARRSSVLCVELEPTTARIAKALYEPHAKVMNMGFEAAQIPDNYFDLVVSNFPFGRYQVACHRRKPYSNWSIHNWFVGRTLDVVRPGGVVAFITSSWFMDSDSDKVRAVVARKAKLVAAYRLPQGAFQGTANTDVVADLVILQKRMPGELMTAAEADAWLSKAQLPADRIASNSAHAAVEVNAYWVNHPAHVLGNWTVQSGQYTRTCVPVSATGTPDKDLLMQLSQLEGGWYTPAQEVTTEVQLDVSINRSLPPGSYLVENNQIYRFDGIGKSLQNMAPKRAGRVRGLVGLRNVFKSLVQEQASLNADEKRMAALRYELNTRYDIFVSTYGCVSHRLNRHAMGKDPTWPLLLSLEHYDEETDSATKADIFERRTLSPKTAPTSAETPDDALAICLAETGQIDQDYIGKLLGRDGADVIAELAALESLYLNPESGKYEEASQYLSGNVREKLAFAQAAGIAFDRHVRALTKSLPQDLLPSEIDVVPGAVWIDEADYSAFAKHLAGDDWKLISWAEAKIAREPMTGTWSVQTNGPIGTAASSQWGTNRKNAYDILEAALNQKDPDVYDSGVDGPVFNPLETANARLKLEDIKSEFTRWLWSDDDRARRLARRYNDQYNCWVTRQYDGSRLRLPGFSHAVQLRDHQLNAIMRMIVGGNVLLAHVVGAGKTLTMVCGTMELRRLGLAKKPVHVVPNPLLSQYCAEFVRAYPGASVLMATKDNFEKQNRRAFVAKCATGDWDAIVITHSMFERIMPDPDVAADYIDSVLAELKATQAQPGIERSASRAINRQIKDWEARLEKMQALWKKDDLMLFSEVGFDHIAYDEAHSLKNLFRQSNMKAIAGLNNNDSQRSFDMFLKSRQIMRNHGDKERGLCFASGTIISNTMAELHTVQRYLQPYTLQSVGLDSFDAWAAQHGRAVHEMEVSPDGSSFRMNRRFKLFTNVPELMGMFRQFADIQTKEMLDLPTPALVTGEHQICVSEASSAVKEYVAKLVERAEAIRDRKVQPNEDNMLAVTGDGRKAALDLRMVMPTASFDPGGKIGKCVANVKRIYDMTAAFKGAQVIFSDMGTPTGKSFNVYGDLRQRLIATGIPQQEIAFIHDAETDVARATLFAKVRAGVVRVILGSTLKLGTGSNIQTRLYAAHHLDVPWTPAGLGQRDGRLERQGNTCEYIEIFRYIAAGTFDAYSWQTLTAKQTFISQVMSGKAESRTVEDAQMAALSFDEVKAIACGNPAVREKAMIDAELMKLAMRKRQHEDAVWRAKARVESLPRVVARLRRKVQTYKQWMSEVVSAKSSPLTLVVGDSSFNDSEKIKKIISLTIQTEQEKKNQVQWVTIGRINGCLLSWGVSRGDPVAHISHSATDESIRLGNYVSADAILKRVSEAEERKQPAIPS